MIEIVRLCIRIHSIRITRITEDSLNGISLCNMDNWITDSPRYVSIYERILPFMNEIFLSPEMVKGHFV